MNVVTRKIVLEIRRLLAANGPRRQFKVKDLPRGVEQNIRHRVCALHLKTEAALTKRHSGQS
jgi:alpha-galactosidase/6-phospho-beta-glucosidase family protein